MKPRVKFATNLEFPFDPSKAMSTHSYQTNQTTQNNLNKQQQQQQKEILRESKTTASQKLQYYSILTYVHVH